MDNPPYRGRGSGINPPTRFDPQHVVQDEWDGIDELPEPNPKTVYLPTSARKLLNPVDSPDIGPALSMNPYQGCEHGCVYCYARNAQEYWGYSAGVDFEQTILVKEDAPAALRRDLSKPSHVVKPIMLAGNTDCYQPAERKFGLTRELLRILLAFRHPVSIITKNALVLRDLDLLQELASRQLVHVFVSMTTQDESLRRQLEPRTASFRGRVRTLERLSKAGVPCGVMTAPIIPGLNSHEIPALLQAAAGAGALAAGYTIVRLNGAVGPIFTEWLERTYPDRAAKVLGGIRACHDGQLNDSQFGRRISGAGPEAESIRQLFHATRARHFAGRSLPPYDTAQFCPPAGKQGALF